MTAFTVGITVTSTDEEAIAAGLATLDARSVVLHVDGATGVTDGACVFDDGDRDVVVARVDQALTDVLPDVEVAVVIQWPLADEADDA